MIRYLFIAFVEGCFVIAVELLGVKMMAPYYGTSLHIWTSVIGVTLACLAAGYYIGGVIVARIGLPAVPPKAGSAQAGNPGCSRTDCQSVLYWILLLSAFLIALMAVTGHSLILLSGNFELYFGSIIHAFLLLGPPLICLGTISPIVIQLATLQIISAGRISGYVYGVSTAGGVFTSLFMGFYVIPTWGLSFPALLLALSLVILTNILNFEKRTLFISILPLAFIVYNILPSYSGDGLGERYKKDHSGKTYNITYRTEGLLGQLAVIDYTEIINNKNIPFRRLLNNGISQTYIANVPPPYTFSFWQYIHFICAYSTLRPKGSSVLLLGFGAGSLSTELSRLGFSTDAVEIDGRMMSIAKDYFYFDDSLTNFIVDDARHYIRINKKKYELVIFDMIKGETQPSYLYTLESFKEVRKFLTESGIFIINFQENIKLTNGLVHRSLYKTLTKAGFFSYVLLLSDNDILFISSPRPIDFYDLNIHRLARWSLAKIQEDIHLTKNLILYSEENVRHDYIFVDNKPLLEELNIKSAIEWRKIMNKDITDKMLKEDIKLFE